jgi:hypothetical protein
VSVIPNGVPRIFVSLRSLAGAGRRKGSAFHDNAEEKADSSGHLRPRNDSFIVFGKFVDCVGLTERRVVISGIEL